MKVKALVNRKKLLVQTSGEPTIQYQIGVADARTHFFQVSLKLRVPPNSISPLVLRLPAWIPGSYMIRDFARHIRGLQAFRRREQKARQVLETLERFKGEPVNLVPLDKDSWQIEISPEATTTDLTVSYEVYAFDQSVRTAYLDQHRAFFNPSSLCLAVAGFEQMPCEIQIDVPAGIEHAKLATGLQSVEVDAAGFGLYKAKDYDELIDCPVEISHFREFQFKAGGASHRFVITGPGDIDLLKIRKQVRAICKLSVSSLNPVFKTKAPRLPLSSMSLCCVWLVTAMEA